MVLCSLIRGPLRNSWADKNFVPHACTFALHGMLSLLPVCQPSVCFRNCKGIIKTHFIKFYQRKSFMSLCSVG